jgi:hypothetical protein
MVKGYSFYVTRSIRHTLDYRLAVLRLALTLMVFLKPVAQAQPFVTVLGGFSTLSADAATELGPPNRVALYSPENGGAVNVGAGVHLNNWLSVQANYIWNSNSLTLTQVRDREFVEDERRSRQHAGVADLLLYFRNRASWVRPYLSAGVGVVHIADTLGGARGDLPQPAAVSDVRPLIRIAVGIDLVHRSGWGFRYSFSEAISGNPYSAVLSPRGPRNLANFQNLFGIVRYF